MKLQAGIHYRLALQLSVKLILFCIKAPFSEHRELVPRGNVCFFLGGLPFWISQLINANCGGVHGSEYEDCTRTAGLFKQTAGTEAEALEALRQKETEEG